MAGPEQEIQSAESDESPDSHEIACRAHDIAFKNFIDWQVRGTTAEHLGRLVADVDKLHDKIKDKL